MGCGQLCSSWKSNGNRTNIEPSSYEVSFYVTLQYNMQPNLFPLITGWNVTSWTDYVRFILLYQMGVVVLKFVYFKWHVRAIVFSMVLWPWGELDLSVSVTVTVIYAIGCLAKAMVLHNHCPDPVQWWKPWIWALLHLKLNAYTGPDVDAPLCKKCWMVLCCCSKRLINDNEQ